MANYKDLHGFQIKSYSSDPSNPIKGEVWYNSTTQVLKGYQSKGAAWESGGDLNTLRGAVRGQGTQTAALAVGGNTPSAPTGVTESYDGTSWSEQPDLNTARHTGGVSQAGSQTAAFYAGGDHNTSGKQNATEEYDGSSWTNGNNYPLSATIGGTGTVTAGLGFGGYLPGTGELYKHDTSEYDGTNWTAGGDMPVERNEINGVGTQTATLAAGGIGSGSPGTFNNSATYDGSSWTATNNLHTASSSGGMFGTQTVAFLFGGRSAPGGSILTTNQSWDGTSWSQSPATLTTARTNMAAVGQSGTAGLAGGGNPNMATTEEYNDPAFGTRTWDAS
tara:strand:+ start:40 stop:1038 length:999 start_codon:yes stop_codon:yes gene_type:complete